jgi:hypothetical protein
MVGIVDVDCKTFAFWIIELSMNFKFCCGETCISFLPVRLQEVVDSSAAIDKKMINLK